ncbi:MAG TPA: dihydroorotate dehydrogenase electron transfer subunit [Candidatus Dormibacteraeota bacterium]|nr:dihydroorotate dehydrogenase electron transfer subunit [Candidatus Dormibacteraeota bacterium]
MTVVIDTAVVLDRTTPMAGAVELVVSHQSAAAIEPGQFFQIGVGAAHTLLRRPYSAAWSSRSSGRVGFIFNVVGAGSAWLANRHAGHELDLLGPLGRGFDLEGDGPAVCIAGGLGVAVFPGVVEALVARGRPVAMLLGARTAAQLLPEERFAGAEVLVATDDGSAGHHGSVVDLMAATTPSNVFACGPTPMLQALVDEARRLEIPLSSIQVALETPMGCGVGTCLGCAAPRRGGGYLLTCQDGPCVRAERLDWSRMTDAFHG